MLKGRLQVALWCGVRPPEALLDGQKRHDGCVKKTQAFASILMCEMDRVRVVALSLPISGWLGYGRYVQRMVS